MGPGRASTLIREVQDGLTSSAERIRLLGPQVAAANESVEVGEHVRF